jgi:hypothetical protein
MSEPCIITVAITGSVPRKENNPAVPITIAEQVESTQAAFEAGATIAHVHVRKDDQTPTSDPERFGQLQEGLRTHCPGMIVQFSTGGRSGKGDERGGMLPLRPDMASLATGSCNFPNIIYENPPALIRELPASPICAPTTVGIRPLLPKPANSSASPPRLRPEERPYSPSSSSSSESSSFSSESSSPRAGASALRQPVSQTS